MTASELAFLALGLLLGAATGGALILAVGSRLPRREIRLTVTPGAVPRRSETLSQDAFVTSAGEPARRGPGDRRWNNRDDESARNLAPGDADVAPVAAPAGAVGIPIGPAIGGPAERPAHRTIVPMGPGRPPGTGASGGPATPQVSTTVPVGAAGASAIAVEDGSDGAVLHAGNRAQAAALERILRGDHRAMVEVLDAVAGDDGPLRREWELLLGGFVDAMAEIAVRESVIDFPMGTRFWDAFTVEQCRHIVAALAGMGFGYDGRDGWVDNRMPAYRDLSVALADVGLDPRRMRAWPNSSDIALLFSGARPAPEELLAAAGPDYLAEDVRELLGDRADAIAALWPAWEGVRFALLEERPLPV